MPSLLLLCLLSASPDVTATEAPTRVLQPGVEVGTGIFGSAYASTGARQGDSLWAVTAQGRVMLEGFTGELQVLALFPLSPDGAALSIDAVPRIGYSWRRFGLLVGASIQLAAVAQPVTQVLPSIRAQADFGSFGVSAGLFDIYGQVPFHLTAELGDFSVGYVAPLGLIASVRFHLSPRVSLKLSGFAYRLFNQETGMLTVGVDLGNTR